GAGEHFLEVEMDATGGNNFGDAATDKFCSVPYAFRSAVSDSLSGLSKTALMGIVQHASSCCSLQESYDVGSVINLNQNNNTSGAVEIGDNNAYPLNSNIELHVVAANPGNVSPFLTPGDFETKYPTNNPMPTVVAENNALGNALQAIVIDYNGASANPEPAIEAAHSGLGSAIHATIPVTSAQYAVNNYKPTIFSENYNLGDAGLFRIINSSSTQAAVRGEIKANTNTLHAQAGSFYIGAQNGTQNNATAVSFQTDGDGSAASFLVSRSTNLRNGINVQTNGSGNAVQAINWGTQGSAGKFRTVQSANTTNALDVLNNGGGCGLSVFNYNPLSKGSLINAHTNVATGFPTARFTNSNANGNVVLLCDNYSPAVTVAARNYGSSVGAGYFVNENSSNNAITLSGINKGTVVYPGTNYGIVGASMGSISAPPGSLPYAVGVYGSIGAGFTTNTSGAAILGTVVTNSQDAYAGYFNGKVNINGGTTITGATNITGTFNVVGNYFQYGAAKSGGSMVKNQNGEIKALTAEETTAEWVSDYNTSQLANGETTISIEPEYLSTVNTVQYTYMVFIQPEGDCKGLFVSNKTSTTFTVKELQGGTSNISFGYKVMAKRKGYEMLHLSTKEQIIQATQQYMQAYWPELLPSAQSSHLTINVQDIQSTIPVPQSVETITLPDLQPSPEIPEAITPVQNSTVTPPVIHYIHPH
ncbi:MAG: hypothetical protein NT126_10295, partial [Bacteroidetes bacterium]|nr:hypothetical protein [Bacteroidota bacterium]